MLRIFRSRLGMMAPRFGFSDSIAAVSSDFPARIFRSTSAGLVALAVIAILGGCATNRVNSRVTRYHELVAKKAQSDLTERFPAQSYASSKVALASAQEELPPSGSGDSRIDDSTIPTERGGEPRTPRSFSTDLDASEKISDDLGETRRGIFENDLDADDESEIEDRSSDDNSDLDSDVKSDPRDNDGDDDEGDGDGENEKDDEDDLDNLGENATANAPVVDRTCVDVNPLLLPEVLQSVYTSYPLIEVAMAELTSADGKTLASWGSFDSVLSGYSISKPLGFYETYRNGAKLSRPLWNGGEVYSGYRIGRGVFEPWYQERQTNEGGEFKTGIKQPLLKGFAIDGRRANIQTAFLERQRLEPDIRARVIGMQLAASQTYWKWVAAGQVVRMQERIVELARQRNETLIKQVKEGDLPKITEIDNGRFIAKRQVKLVESRRKVQEAAIKLSLFFRDEAGEPIVVDDDRLPCDFPDPSIIDQTAVEADIAAALQQRPELLELDFQRRQVEVALCYAKNSTLPKLDAYAEAGQDVGEPTSSKRDKSELEIEMGIQAEVPLQRREALGKIQAARGKLAQIDAKRRFTIDKIRSQVQDAVSALNNAYERIRQARENLRLTEQSLRLGRLRFEEGDIDIIDLNIYETSLADAELLLIEAEFEYFSALAEYLAALATGQ